MGIQYFIYFLALVDFVAVGCLVDSAADAPTSEFARRRQVGGGIDDAVEEDLTGTFFFFVALALDGGFGVSSSPLPSPCGGASSPIAASLTPTLVGGTVSIVFRPPERLGLRLDDFGRGAGDALLRPLAVDVFGIEPAGFGSAVPTTQTEAASLLLDVLGALELFLRPATWPTLAEALLPLGARLLLPPTKLALALLREAAEPFLPSAAEEANDGAAVFAPPSFDDEGSLTNP